MVKLSMNPDVVDASTNTKTPRKTRKRTIH